MNEKILVLKTIRADGKCYYSEASFVYPEVGGEVVAPKWKPTDECDEFGLYGLGYGVGGANYLNDYADALWLVIEVDPADYHEMDDKCKFRAGTVVYRGAKEGAIRMLCDAYPDKPVVFAMKSGGLRSTLTGGHHSTLTGGDGSMLCWKVWDGERYRLHVRYVGEDGIKADTPYKWVNGEIAEVTL